MRDDLIAQVRRSIDEHRLIVPGQRVLVAVSGGLDSVVLLTIAQYIRNLGYQAIPSMNDTALAIPYALEAGLGEYGRHGLLITPEFGPRLRLGKIFTNLPLERDRPTSFGVEKRTRVTTSP